MLRCQYNLLAISVIDCHSYCVSYYDYYYYFLKFISWYACDREREMFKQCLSKLKVKDYADSDRGMHLTTNPSIRNLSLTSIRWGEMKSPVRKPHSRKIASQNVHVEPWKTKKDFYDNSAYAHKSLLHFRFLKVAMS